MKILAIYDNEKTLDRYSVYLDYIEKPGFHACFCMDASCRSVAMHAMGMLGVHNGKKIAYKELPEACKNTLEQLNYTEL